MINQTYIHNETIYSLETYAQQLMLKRWSKDSPCWVEEKNFLAIKHLLKNKQACSLKEDKKQFFYLIEDLGLFPCLQTMIAEMKYSTHHTRPTIMDKKENNFLQIRVAYTEPLQSCDKQEIVNINPGVLSWHYLTSE